MVATEDHQLSARLIRQVYARYQENKDLISIGAYTKGSDQRIDLAIAAEPAINLFFQQEMKDVIPYQESVDGMLDLNQALREAQ